MIHGLRNICRRQTALHGMIAQAGAEGSDAPAIQAPAPDPCVNSLSQAKKIWHDFREIYREELTTFR